MDKNAIKEISDVVIDEVMPKVDGQLSSLSATIKENVLRMVINTVEEKYASKLHSLQRENEELSRKLSSMEKAISSMNSENNSEVIALLTEKCESLEKYINSLENKTTSSLKVQYASSFQSASKRGDGVNTLSNLQLNEIRSHRDRYLESNGWIYYVNIILKTEKDNSAIAEADRTEKMLQKHGLSFGTTEYVTHNPYGELFKVRVDGTNNQKIYPGLLKVQPGLHIELFRLNGNNLEFIDSYGVKRSIRI